MAGVFAFLVGQSAAWEFDLQGTFQWSHEWYNQQGTQGFLGPYNVDNGVGTAAANLNFWNGGQFDNNLTTGARANWSDFFVDFFPVVKVNPAIRIQARLRLGQYESPFASKYVTQGAPGVQQPFSEGQWTLFWVTAQTPWGTFGIGKRPWVFGNGLQYDGSDAATTESVALVAPWGPFDIGIAFYPYRFAGRSGIPVYRQFDNPYDLPLYPTVSGLSVQPGQYFSQADAGGTFSTDFLGFVAYTQGPLSAGILGAVGSYHIGPEALLIDPADPPVVSLVPLDADLSHGTAFVRYKTARFFMHAEVAWLNWTDRFQADPTGFIGPPNTRYIEQWRYMIELGAMAGPAKITLLHVWTPGPDRRSGIFIDRQPAAFVRHDGFDRLLGNHSVIHSYSAILAFDYGFGLGAYNLTFNGYVRDASVLAARLDYALASNLNLFGTFLYANRTSHGYSWGCIGPNAGAGSFAAVPDGNLSLALNRYPAAPNIPDSALGYEIDAGFDWRLLEGWTASILAGYWKPGKWFSYACIDRSVPGWQTGVPENLFGTRPSRNIDAVLGGQFNLIFAF